MKIPELNSVEMIRTSESHFGNSKVVSVTQNVSGFNSVEKVNKVGAGSQTPELSRTGTFRGKSFENYLVEALDSVNSQQQNVSSLQQKVITNPDEVDIHDVTIAMSKAQMSLNLAKSVIDRLVSGWNEISTTR